MRRILINQARKKKAIKHGGDLERVNVQEIDLHSQMQDGRLQKQRKSYGYHRD